MIKQETFRTLGNNSEPILVEYEAEEMGSGSQGSIYRVVRVRRGQQQREPSNFLLKIYDGIQHPQQQARMQAFCQHLNARSHLRNGPLLGLPTYPIASEYGIVAVFMDCVPGKELGEDTIGEQLSQSHLVSRLNYAWQLAAAIAKLHAADILHADITLSNVMVDYPSNMLYVIDVDGGGILAPGGFASTLAPIVKYKPGESCGEPPELKLNMQALPNVGSDNWALGILLFRLLTAHLVRNGLTPFMIYEQKQLQLLYGSHETRQWPSPGDIGDWWRRGPSGRSPYDMLLLQMDGLGAPIKSLFQRTFGNGRLAPEIRSSAQLWTETLDEARRWVIACDCGKELVAAGRGQCPWCSRQIPHARWRTTGAGGEIQRDCNILPGVRVARTAQGAYIVHGQTSDIAINNAQQTPELRSGTHTLSVTDRGRRLRRKVELLIP